VGRPVLVGPHTFNFSRATQDAIEAGAALRVGNASELVQNAVRLLRDEATRTAMGEAARAFTQAHRGATRRMLSLVEPLLAAP
jgi:3-deoxy-D-manno-octulosonic-acid transferase